MVLRVNSVIVDSDLDLLKDMLNILEQALMDIDERIRGAMKESLDPDSIGLFDKGEYIIGLAFTACQKYISSIVSVTELKKEDAIKVGRKLSSGESCINVIHAAANYWKHCDEWDVLTAMPSTESEMLEIIVRDSRRLKTREQHTINTIQKVSSWSDYTCSGVLASISSAKKISVLALVPILVEWRDTILKVEVQ